MAELTEAGHTAFAFRSDARDRAAAHAGGQRGRGPDGRARRAGQQRWGGVLRPLRRHHRGRRPADPGHQCGRPLWAVQAAVPLMTGGGRIVLMSSVSNGIAVYEHSLYAASKAAVVALARNLAPELAARDIAINAIAPGGTATDMATENAPHYTHPLLRGYDMSPKAQISLHASLGRVAAGGDRGRDRISRLARRQVPQWRHAGRRRRLDVAVCRTPVPAGGRPPLSVDDHDQVRRGVAVVSVPSAALAGVPGGRAVTRSAGCGGLRTVPCTGACTARPGRGPPAARYRGHAGGSARRSSGRRPRAGAPRCPARRSPGLPAPPGRRWWSGPG